MKRKDFIKWTGLAVLSPLAVLESCKPKADKAAAAVAVTTYTCPMHPQIVQTKMGTCPICGMDLVVFDKNNKDAFLTLSREQQLLANVTVLEIGSGKVDNITRVNGRLVVNPGSVGCPAYQDDHPVHHRAEAGTPHACYAVLDRTPAGWSVSFRRNPYDTSRAVARAARRGAPDWASALASGWLLPDAR